MSEIIKQAIYNADKTECLEIGYQANFDDGHIQILKFPPTIKKVPNSLPKQITSLKNAFKDNLNENIDGIENWDTSNVEDMECMFYGATSFNQDISNWDTSKVKSMDGMFTEAKSFNQPIGKWNTSNVINMDNMFYGATSFNQDISSWDVSKVKYMWGMFYGAKNFNQPIGKWNVENVKNKNNMLLGAKSFNQDLSNWDTTNVYHFKPPEKKLNFNSYQKTNWTNNKNSRKTKTYRKKKYGKNY
ncbi:DUF285 domain-containing protein [Mycoplasma mycoides subsp. capri]|uniref:BspA family leucine-rich repeat surface protein n=1 Tax=Mycoplasma mycoides TaxID=2102 RepID=UPI00223F09CF|nr:BspA family leucine-rich repeat surface protein [Mycoplasma mycoides]UZK63964.1 DUF285 domain-containing protein [Mycoplasma mycoides subsp. capri]